MKVVKNNETAGHLPCEYSQLLWYFIAHSGNIIMRGGNWPHLSLQTVVWSNGDSLYVGV